MIRSTLPPTLALLTVVLTCATAAPAQQPGKPPTPSPIEAELFPPDLVMQHQRDIGLTEAQSQELLAALKKGQAEMLELQWKLSPELEQLRRILAEPRVEEQRVRSQLARVTQHEHRVKEVQLLLMVRVKNLLTPEQQEQLRRLRPAAAKP